MPHPLTFSDLLAEHGEHFPLDLGAALLAAEEQPGVDPYEIIGSLDRLALGARIPFGTNLFEAVARLNHYLFGQLGFAGDTEVYDDPRNSLLDHVLSRRRGLPILLSVIYVEVARRNDVAIDPIGFPGHFVVSPHGSEPRFFIDPFNGGMIIREESLLERLAEHGDEALTHADQHLAPISARQVLVRMSLYLWGSWQRRGDVAGVIRNLERVLLLEPPHTAQAHRIAFELARARGQTP